MTDFYEPDSTETIVNGELHGWTGRPCPNCKGSGEADHPIFGWTRCTDCAGTGDEYDRLDDQPPNLPPRADIK